MNLETTSALVRWSRISVTVRRKGSRQRRHTRLRPCPPYHASSTGPISAAVPTSWSVAGVLLRAIELPNDVIGYAVKPPAIAT